MACLALQRNNERSIPAWAGKPGGSVSVTAARWPGLSPRGRGNLKANVSAAILRGVYPRVGGETLSFTDPGVSAGRSIPAWAGKPRARCRPVAAPRVYPRVGGETLTATWRLTGAAGVYPRVGGETMLRHEQRGNSSRSIPAWAGKPARHGGRTRPGPCSYSARLRSIPAWAGKPHGSHVCDG